MLYYFYGEDTYRARQAIEELAEEEKARVRWLDQSDFEDKSPGEILGRGSRGLFGQELVVLRDFTELPASLQSDVLDALDKGVTLCVLWGRTSPDKRSAVYKKFGKQAKVFDLPTPPVAAGWVRDQAEERGGQIDEAAARELVERVGTDSWRLITELEKLLVTHKKISVAMVIEVVPEAPTAEIFSMLEALTRGDGHRAVRSVEILLNEGNSEFYILSMLAYQFRTLLKVRRGIDKNQTQAVIAKEGDMKAYAVQKNYAHAQRFTASYLRGALTRILATDFSIKQGKVDARTGLLMLVLTLAKAS